jgi:hypothetical protein
VTGTFKANIPYNQFLLLLYGFLLKLPMFISPVVPSASKSDAFLYKELLAFLLPLGKGFPFIYSIIAFFLLYFQALSLNRMVNQQRLLPKPNYLTGMFYLLITSIFPGWYGLHAALIAATLLIWILSKLCTIGNDPKIKFTLLNIGMVAGICTFFYFPAIIYVLLILAALAITRTFKLPEWLMVFLGIGTPYYFLWAWLFLTGGPSNLLAPTFAMSKVIVPTSIWSWVAISLLLVLLAVGIVFIQKSMRRLLVQSRKNWTVIYLFLLLAMIIPFLNKQPALYYWMLSSIPLSAIAAAAFFFPERKWFSFVVHWGLVAMIVVLGGIYVMNSGKLS